MRTQKATDEYKAFRDSGGLDVGCALCSGVALKSFRFWKIMENRFPYDKIAAVHHMIVPLRHASEDEVNADEWQEWKEIKHATVGKEYDFFVEATNKKKSIPSHFHIHLIVATD